MNIKHLCILVAALSAELAHGQVAIHVDVEIFAPGACNSSKEYFVRETARRYGATLHWVGVEHVMQKTSPTSLELYTSKQGWSLLRVSQRSTGGQACLIDAGTFGGERTTTPYSCDHDPSIAALVELVGPLRAAYRARSDFAPRAYIIFVEDTVSGGRWAVRGSAPELTGTQSAAVPGQCTTTAGPRSTALRPFL